MGINLNRVLEFFWWLTILTRADSVCPCKNPDWCLPIRASDRKEVFLFSIVNDNTTWSKYDWTRTTTVGTIPRLYSADLMCVAHQHNSRVVLLVDYPGSDLTNASKRTAWVKQQLETVQADHLDGVNIDFEEEIDKNDTERIQGLTDLVNETFRVFKQAMPHYQVIHLSKVTMDVPYGPDCIYNRCFDFKTLASFVDFFFIMDYDEWGGPVAGPNSGFQRTAQGLMRYMQIVPSLKLLLGVPWYGYKYKCSKISQNNSCTVDGRPTQMVFSDIYDLLFQTHSQRMWSEAELSPYFTYNDTSDIHQIWYDDPQSLFYKYNMAAKSNLRGVGVWNANCVSYKYTPLDNAVRQWMWDALPLVQ